VLWLAYLEGLTQGIRVATYPERAVVLAQLAAWVTQDGIDSRSTLAANIADAQTHLREQFANPHY
jgi:hypothetical protein